MGLELTFYKVKLEEACGPLAQKKFRFICEKCLANFENATYNKTSIIELIFVLLFSFRQKTNKTFNLHEQKQISVWPAYNHLLLLANVITRHQIKTTSKCMQTTTCGQCEYKASNKDNFKTQKAVEFHPFYQISEAP